MMTDKDRLLLQSLIIKFALSTLTLEEMETAYEHGTTFVIEDGYITELIP